MKITVLLAQFPVTLSIPENLAAIQQVIEAAQPGDWLIFPEGAVSGYSSDITFLEQVNQEEVEAGLEHLQGQARKRGNYIWAGACYFEAGHWYNAAFGFTPAGNRYRYNKANLATHERGFMATGSELPVFAVQTDQGVVRVGVQICRELRFPEQWTWLAQGGAQLFLHLNNAVGGAHVFSVWRSHLVSRAAETQRFVFSVNNADTQQTSPTVAISPQGQVLGEISGEKAAFLRVEADLTQVLDWYLNQRREDLVSLYRPANP